MTDLLESFLETARIVDTHNAAEEEVGNKAHAYGDEETHPEPQHSMVDNPRRKEGVRIKESCNDEHEDGIPEIFDLVGVHIIVLILIVLELQKAEFVKKEDQGTKNDKAGSNEVHVLVPILEYLNKRVYRLHGM